MFSLITCSADDTRFAAFEESCRHAMAGADHELLRISDATSIAAAYNSAADRARGDILLFCHDDIEILSPDFPDTVQRALRRFDIVGIAGTTKLIGPSWPLAAHPYIFGQVVLTSASGMPYHLQVFGVPRREVGGIQALDGVFLAARRSVLDRVRFDAERFDGFHLYDIDFTYAAHLAGLQLGVACDIHLIHHSPGHYGATWRHYAERFAEKYPMQSWYAPMPNFSCTVLALPDRSRLAEVMTPAFWSDPLP